MDIKMVTLNIASNGNLVLFAIVVSATPQPTVEIQQFQI